MSNLWPRKANMRWPKIHDSDVALSDLVEWIMDNVLAARLLYILCTIGYCVRDLGVSILD